MRRRDRIALAMALLAATFAAVALPQLLQARLAQLPAPERSMLQARVARWNGMTATGQRELRQALAHWHALPQAQRRERREQWQAWQALSLAQQAQLRTAVVHFDSLPPAQQQAVRAQYDALDASDRHGWLLGPQLGADWPRLQPLLAQVPAEERLPLLALLNALDPDARAALATLAQRVPPQERDRLRRGLLQVAPAARARWLQQQLQQ